MSNKIVAVCKFFFNLSAKLSKILGGKGAKVSGKTRVEEYKSLRDQIENIDVYSFDDRSKIQSRRETEPLIPVHDIYDDEDEECLPPDDTSFTAEDHIKKNTLSLSIDELIKQHEAYTEALERDEIDKRVKDKKTTSIKSKIRLTFNARFLMWVIIALVIIAVIIIVSLVLGGQI